MRHHCSCPDDQLCERCYEHAQYSLRPQAATIGVCWAERVARGEHRAREAWPTDGRVLELAAAKVASLTADPRLRSELAASCVAGAAVWWASRPARYRV